jgi:uncharacterized alkaline shock family protein YloU
MTQNTAMAQSKVAPLHATQMTTELGRTSISDAVVAKIAGIAAREIKGVYALVPQGVSDTLVGLAQKVTGSDMRGHGVNVEVGTREAAVDLNIVAHYGVNIPQVADEVRQNIIEKVKAMTGLIVKEVNVEVSDLYFPEDDAPKTPERRVE